MKIKVTLLFLMIVGLTYAQKREMRKIGRAIEKQDFAEAKSIFNEIDPSEVEEEYEAEYQFYKAATIVDLTGVKKATLLELREAEKALNNAKEFGFENEEYMAVVSNNIDARKFELANKALTSGDTKTAYMLINEVYQANPDNLAMLYNAANIAYSIEMYDEALEKYNILLDNNYTGVVTTYVATNVANNQEEVFPSKQLRDVAVQTRSHVNPKEEKSPSNLGDVVIKTVWLYKNNGDIEEAKSLFKNVLDENPEDQSLVVAKPEIYLLLDMMEQYEKATKEMSKEVKDPKVYDNLAYAAYKKKDYDKAIQYYELSLSVDDTNFAALVNLSNAYLEKGNLEKTTAKEQRELYKNSIDYLEQALEIKPKEKGIIQTLISLYGVFEMEDKVAEMKARL